MQLSTEQYEALLQGLNPAYVANRRGGGGATLSYVEAWHIKRTLTRIFGFGGWSAEVLEAEHMFTEEVPTNRGVNYHVGYKVLMRLTIVDTYGMPTCFTEAAVGSATLPQLGEAHDMAVKTAESDALKRCAINLGDQFGLSLYNGGSVEPVVVMTLNPPSDYLPSEPRTNTSINEGTPLPTPPPDSEEGAAWHARMAPFVRDGDAAGLIALRTEANVANANDLMYRGRTVASWFDTAMQQVGQAGVRDTPNA